MKFDAREYVLELVRCSLTERAVENAIEELAEIAIDNIDWAEAIGEYINIDAIIDDAIDTVLAEVFV